MDITIVSTSSVHFEQTRKLIAKTVNTLEKLGYKLYGKPDNLLGRPLYEYTGDCGYDLLDGYMQAIVVIKNARPRDETLIRLAIGDGWKLLWR